MQSIVAWSRILHTQEVLCAFNTDVNQSQTAWVTVDNDLHTTGDVLTCLYTTHPEATFTNVSVAACNGKAVQLTLPPGSFVLYKKQ